MIPETLATDGRATRGGRGCGFGASSPSDHGVPAHDTQRPKMKTSRLDLPHIKLQIAQGIAHGQSQRQIAQALGSSQPAISRIARRNDLRELIRKEEKRLMVQVEKMLEKIQNDPRFLAEFQKALEKELLNFKGLL